MDANSSPFISLCHFLERLSAFKLPKKKEHFENFVRSLPPETDLFPVLRLIFPDADSSRGAYGLKEHTVGRLLADVLALPDKEKRRLIGWKDPNLQAGHRCTVGDFPSVLLSVIEPRMSSAPLKPMSLGDVNTFLDSLYAATDNDARKDLFMDLIYKTKALEVKWIMRIIMKDLKIGLGVESILRHLHPNAVHLYHMSSSLQHVLTTISRPDQVEDSPGPATVFFQPFKPMLSERVNPGDIPQRFAHMHAPIFLEPKLDGERMLVHIDKRSGGIVFFSRNGVNFTKRYGDHQLSPLLLTAFKGLGAVFDGELVAWDPAKRRIHAFGSNRDIGYASVSSVADTQGDAEELGVSAEGNLFYIVFDLVFYVDIDGKEHDLRNTPLEARKELLSRILIPVPHRVEIVKSRFVQDPSVDDIKNFLKTALDKREEGVIVKRAHSVYKLNIRGMGWYKLKADYDSVFSDTLDLVVLGGYFSPSATGSETHPIDSVTSFLVGVPKSVGDTTEFKTVTKVGGGLTETQFVFLRNQLKPAIIPVESGTLPSWFGAWKPSKPNRPDIVFSPFLKENSVVLEIRAGEITETSDFSSGFQLRFPRVVRPRADKDWTDATSFDDLRDMATVDRDQSRTFIQDLSRFERGYEVKTSPKVDRKRKKDIVIIDPGHGLHSGTQ